MHYASGKGLFARLEVSSDTYTLYDIRGEAGMSDAREWLTTRETMALLGISRTRLWQLVREGRLIPYQRGANRKVRYYRGAEVERVAAESRPTLLHKMVDAHEEDK